MHPDGPRGIARELARTASASAAAGLQWLHGDGRAACTGVLCLRNVLNCLRMHMLCIGADPPAVDVCLPQICNHRLLRWAALSRCTCCLPFDAHAISLRTSPCSGGRVALGGAGAHALSSYCSPTNLTLNWPSIHLHPTLQWQTSPSGRGWSRCTLAACRACRTA